MDQEAEKGAPGKQAVPFQFHGSGSEYFGIFIVNLCLTVLTVGIYSAWAKVRTQRYFYGSTTLDGHSFDYLANPVAILKGRLVVFAAFVAFNIAAELAPLLAFTLFVVFLAILPALLNRGLRFNARVSAYRNVRFDWQGTYWRTAFVYLVWPIVGTISAGLLLPFVSRATGRYRAAGHRYGNAGFEADPSIGTLYRALGLAALVFGAVAITVAAVFGVVLALTAGAGAEVAPVLTAALTSFLPFILVITSLAAAATYGVWVRNAVLNALVLDSKHTFASRWKATDVLWITATNLLLLVVTLGLAYPWTRVRLVRYQLENTAVFPAGDLESITDTLRREGDAVGAEYMDVEGFDSF